MTIMLTIILTTIVAIMMTIAVGTTPTPRILFAEKDALIDALNRELQAMKSRGTDLDRQVTDLEDRVREKQNEIDALHVELRKAEEKKPSQVLETLVYKLKKQQI
jgi:peptidoglycan hydrolase CwlO-like protein